MFFYHLPAVSLPGVLSKKDRFTAILFFVEYNLHKIDVCIFRVGKLALPEMPFLQLKWRIMQQDIFCYNYNGIIRKDTPLQFLAGTCCQILVFCIALPLACCVLCVKGVGRVFRLLANLSFICCVWIFLACVVLLFLLAITVHLAVASVG